MVIIRSYDFSGNNGIVQIKYVQPASQLASVCGCAHCLSLAAFGAASRQSSSVQA